MSSRSHEAKLSKVMRDLLSFVLFLLVALLSVSICVKSTFANRSFIENQFTSFEYVSGVRDNICDYAKDLCAINGIPDDNVETIFSFSNVQEVVESYYGNYIGNDMQYSTVAYEKNIQSLCNDFGSDIKNQLSKTNLSYNEETANSIVDLVNECFKSAVELPSIDKIDTAINIVNIILYVVMGVSGFFALAVALIMYFIGTKRYRSVRAMSISFMSAGVFELFLCLIVYIISCVKSVDIYPVYIANQFVSYLYAGLSSIACCAGALILVSIIISIIVWKMRKNTN